MFSQYQQNHDLKTFLLNTDYSVHFSSLFFSRSSRPDVFCEKSVLQNFTKFAGKHLCQSLFFNKAAGLWKKETLAQVFSCEFCENFKKSFSIEHLRWLLPFSRSYLFVKARSLFHYSSTILFHSFIAFLTYFKATWAIYYNINHERFLKLHHNINVKSTTKNSYETSGLSFRKQPSVSCFISLSWFRKYQRTLEKTPVIEHGCRKEFFNTGDFKNCWGKSSGIVRLQSVGLFKIETALINVWWELIFSQCGNTIF